jgi:tRNA pseudouridine38-40 synthase
MERASPLSSCNQFYRLVISYCGIDYSGWQIQNQGQRTIQGEVEKALVHLFGNIEKKVIASGRTDAGVHALGQVIRIELGKVLAPQALRNGLNSVLPLSIRVLKCEVSSSDFHPIGASKNKTYHYLFQTWEHFHPLLEGRVAFLKGRLTDEKKMLQAASLFKGVHDFCNFFTTGSEVHSTTREIYCCELNYCENYFPPEFGGSGVYRLEICGNGFLKQMVRMIVGALWCIGQGKAELADLEIFLKVKQEKRLGAVAPADGLYLYSVEYP